MRQLSRLDRTTEWVVRYNCSCGFLAGRPGPATVARATVAPAEPGCADRRPGFPGNRHGEYRRARRAASRRVSFGGACPDRVARGARHRAGPAGRGAGPGEEHSKPSGGGPGAQGMDQERTRRGKPSLRPAVPHPARRVCCRPGVAGAPVASGADSGRPVRRGAGRPCHRVARSGPGAGGRGHPRRRSRRGGGPGQAPLDHGTGAEARGQCTQAGDGGSGWGERW